MTGLTLVPVPALAEVCDKERPLWSRMDGPATALDEMLNLWLSGLGLLALGLVLCALVLRWRSLLLIVLILTGAFGWVIWSEATVDPTGIRHFALQEGCIGPPHLFLASCAAICGVLIYFLRRPRA